MISISSHKNKSYNSLLNIYSLYFISLPLGMISLGNAGSALRYIALFPIFSWLLISRQVKFNKICKLQLILTIYMLLTSLFTVDYNATITRTISNGMFFVLLMTFSSVELNENEGNKLKKALVMSSRLSIMLLLWFGTLQEGRLVLHNEIIIEDANYINAYLLFGIVNAEINIISKNVKIFKRVLYCIEFLIYVYITLCTGSRSGLLMIFVSVIIAFVFSKNKNGNRSMSFLSKLISISFIVIILYNVVLTYVPTDVLTRFSIDSLLQSNGTNRYVIWKNGLTIYKKSGIFRQIFGYGAGTIIKVFLTKGYRPIVMHQIYLEILVEDGIIGLIIYLTFLAYVIAFCIKKHDIFCLSIIIGLMVFGCAASIYAFKPYWNILLYLCAVNSTKNQKPFVTKFKSSNYIRIG